MVREVAGTGDFNGDRKTPILWRYYGTGAYQGLNNIWYMNGTTFMGEDVFSQVADTNWRMGVDLITVKEILRHSSVTTTERYTHTLQEQKECAVDLLAGAESSKTRLLCYIFVTRPPERRNPSP